MEISMSFPKSRQCLWDSSSVGRSVDVCFTRLGWPRLVLKRNILRLAERSCRDRGRHNCFFVAASLFSSDEGPVFEVNRYDPGRAWRAEEGEETFCPTALSAGEFPIKSELHQRSVTQMMTASMDVPDVMYSMGQIALAVQEILSRCMDSRPADPKDLVDVRVMVHIMDDQMKLSCGCVMLNDVYEAVPINAIPIVPTPLARGLSGPAHSLQMQQRIRFGYLSMEETRKIILLLDSDTKASVLPLVGIWVSGISSIHHPQVWATCVHYVFSQKLNDRVYGANDTFVLVLYTLSSKPQFWQCQRKPGKDFDILTGTTCIECQSDTTSSQDITLVRLMPELDSSALPTLLQSVLSEPANTLSQSSWDGGRTRNPPTSLYGEDMPHPLTGPFPTPQQAPVLSRSQDLSLCSACDDVQRNSIDLPGQVTPTATLPHSSQLSTWSDTASNSHQIQSINDSSVVACQPTPVKVGSCSLSPPSVTNSDLSSSRAPLKDVNSSTLPSLHPPLKSEGLKEEADDRIAKQEEQLIMLQRQVENLLRMHQQQQEQHTQTQSPPSNVSHKTDASTSVGVSLVESTKREDTFARILPPKSSSRDAGSTAPTFPRSPQVSVNSSVWTTSTADLTAATSTGTPTPTDGSTTLNSLSSHPESGEDPEGGSVGTCQCCGEMKHFSQLSPPVVGESASVVRQGATQWRAVPRNTDQQLYKHLLANVQQLLSSSVSEDQLSHAVSEEDPLTPSIVSEGSTSPLSSTHGSRCFCAEQRYPHVTESCGVHVNDLPPGNPLPPSVPMPSHFQYLSDVSMLAVPRIALSDLDVSMTTICEEADKVALKYLQTGHVTQIGNGTMLSRDLSLATKEYYKRQGLQLPLAQENVLDIAHLRQLPKLF